MIDSRAMDLKAKLAAGRVCPGVWLRLPSPEVAEIIGGAAPDWVLFDDEHSAGNPEALQHILMALGSSPAVRLVRVPWNDHVMIKKALDMGWDGVVVPQVNTAEEARRAVAACRYPPEGVRGFGPMRASGYYRDQARYLETANRSVFCIIQVEDVRAAGRAKELVSVPGIDGVFVGRFDMSGTTDTFGDPESPAVWSAVDAIFRAARAAGVPYGNATDDLQKNQQMGCQFVVVGEDLTYLRDGVDRALADFKRVFP
jgi:4-hydroxy-2-oxoheptanedioate aldolase